MLTLKNIRDVISLASDVRELSDLPQILLGLDPVDVYVGALCATLEAERESLGNRGTHLIYDRRVFAALLGQKAIDLEERSVAAGPLTEAIGDQVAALVLDERFLSGVDRGVDVDLGWARRMVGGAHRRYEDKIYALLPQKAVQLALRNLTERISEIATRVDDIPEIRRRVEALDAWSG